VKPGALHRVEWDLPDGFDELCFFLLGTKRFDWEPPIANRILVISHFCKQIRGPAGS